MAAVTYQCPNCSGGLLFDPATQKFHCEYCSSLFTQQELEHLAAAEAARNAQEEENKSSQSRAYSGTEDFEQHAVAYSCPNCGAQIICEETTAATFCYYCHNPVVLAGRLSGSLKPDKVIPFEITKENAVERFLEWAKKKKFIPHAFFSKDQIEKISGVYFPYWFTDCEMQASLDTTATNLRIWRVGETEYTETSIFRIQRTGNASFRNLSRFALSKMNATLAEGVQPFDTTKMLDFSMSYLSGFQAEKRDIEAQSLAQAVCDEAGGYTSSMLRESVKGYGSVSPGNFSAQMKSAHWRYVLLPVWVVTYKGGDGTMYYYTMNGQNGRVCGKLPLDWKRLAALFAGISIPLFGILTLWGYLL